MSVPWRQPDEATQLGTIRAVASPVVDNPGTQVGQEVRARRRAAKMSIAELARRAQVSAPFVSQLESGRSSLSLVTLYRIATALSCSANALLGSAPSRPHVTRAGDGPRLPASGGSHPQQPRLLSRTGPGVMIEAYHYLIQPDDDAQEWFEHDGEDFVYVIRGTVVVEFGDGTEVELSAGDSLHHGGTPAHRWALRQPEPAEVIISVASSPAAEFTQP
jgi:transcriptional regulator with XRE-family HTH domain